ncbi:MULTISPECIES: GGDEF domain-containing phosphodiesterase [unclassified Halomonas]|uniref:putative bifunctional diguanylate cyclase/phosphodiesterase n=1 Tax=unclassified Halomonas TaxID=2609666 RepID=UPI000C96E8C1|nr:MULTISPECIES: GGDEF domain-containing phosphodiesterase [unclassified Halomonas]MAR72933.1 GGDEF domain-containing protein [Halomonas sp.]MBR9881352.1 EAL domain-containing protein [Gammaproteobacteria bacterium]RQW69026.1 phosphodiesterase [Halomonas sp. YLB-10]
MWPRLSFNRPLIWLGLSAMSAVLWLPSVSLRLGALLLMAVAMWDGWRQVKLEQRRSRLTEQVMRQSGEAVMITDDQHRIQAVNPAFTELSGFELSEVAGLSASNLAAARHDSAFFERFWQALISAGRWEGELWQRRKDGSEYPMWLEVQVITDPHGRAEHHIATFTDISLRKAREQDLRRIGREDPLTGLPNRFRLHELLASRLRHLRAGECLDLALIDIDGFKEINDGLGVSAGDRLLARFGKRLAGHVAGGVVGRLGGDEFMVLRTTTYDDHERWVEGLRSHLGEPFEIDGSTLRLGITIGSCRAPEDGNDDGVLFQRMEAALASARRHGGNCCQRFRPALDVGDGPNLTLLNDLREALAQGGQLELHYQPQHRLADDAMIGMEALLRWRHPRDGMISPAEFIPLAERHGLMAPLGDWVIHQALTQLAHWRSRGLSPLPVWINISAMQLFQGDLEKTLAAGRARHDVASQWLGLELTESVLLDDRGGDIVPRLERLRDLGHRIALDDFGTGYSSLGYLKELPLDKLKLDRAFIKALPGDSADAAIVNAVTAMARGLSLEILAEGVETAEQRDYLRQAGCDEVQGYFYARPMPAHELEALWRESATRQEANTRQAVA